MLRCIDFARQYELEVAVRSGNHSFLGWGTCNEGIVVELSRMKGIVVDPVKRTVVVNTGSTAEPILAATSAHGLAPVLGQCGGVGSGLVLGGGLGWLSGRHGATCDNLVSAHIVTAEGRSLLLKKNEEWSGLRESNSHLNLGKVRDKLQKRRKWRLFQRFEVPQMENGWKMGDGKSRYRQVTAIDRRFRGW